MQCASSHNQRKDNNKFKNKKQPELTGKQTVWKSNNKGDKEETFIQTGSRGRDGQPGQRGLAARQQLADPARWRIVEQGRQGCSWPARRSWQILRGGDWPTLWSHIHTQINREEKGGVKQTMQPQGSSTRK